MLLGLEGESAVRSGWRELEQRVQAAGREWTGAIAQPLAAAGVDVLVGAFTDPDLGPVIAVGLGGSRAGLGETVAFRLPPTTDVEADELIDSCRAVATALDAFPDAAALAREPLRELILRFALLLREVPEIVEADLNPVRCSTESSLVLNARLRIEPGARPNASRRGDGLRFSHEQARLHARRRERDPATEPRTIRSLRERWPCPRRGAPTSNEPQVS